MQLRGLERWIALVRLLAFPFAAAAVVTASFPPGAWAMWAWVMTAGFAAGALGFFFLARSELASRHQVAQSLAAQLFDTAVVTAYVMVFSFERGTPVQQILYIDLAAACVRFEILGGLALAVVSIPILAGFEQLRDDQLQSGYSWQLVGFQTGLEVLMALIVGWLVRRLAAAGAHAEARAEEAERLHEAERRTVEELRRLSALRADFVSLVSHEVRTPMAAVIGSARTLAQRWRELTAEQRDAFLALIAEETDRLAALVGEVLDSSRIDAGTFSCAFGELDLASLIGDTVAAAELHRDSVKIVARIVPGLPPVRGDRARLRQVLTNLIDNAVKYSPEGAPVDVWARTSNGHVLVQVADRGAGISPEDQKLIFEKFSRVRGTESTPGTGLGLYIARAIAEAHEGTLEVVSALGEGATFTLTLPLGS
ncbi:MAG TPA: HAMP domain-containing sensor histidine kinase [Gaiellaceae bacterium]|nr:HAMP domain-containing sensor histidine kinase [Gaiellaceae bacterium]